MKDGELDKRATKRWTVGLAAECNLGESVTSGLVRDMTQTGAFFVTDSGGSNGIKSLSEAPLDQKLRVGDKFLLTLLKSNVMNRRSVTATVIWEGRSTEHGCHGYGVLYDTP